jgi:hypothetical protein
MKILRVLLGAALVLPVAVMSSTNSNLDAIEEQDGLSAPIKHGRDGRPGRNGENGQNGEDGQNGGNGGNGGNSDWGRGGDGGNGGDASANATPAQTNGQVDEWEYKILKDTCRQIIANTISWFYGQASIPSSESVWGAVCKQRVSSYLLQVGTLAARKLFQEYENVKWSYPAIADI